MLKKLVLSLVLAVFSLFAILPQYSVSHAQWWDPDLQQFQTKVQQGDPNDIFGERYTFAQVKWIVLSLITILQGKHLASCAVSNNLAEGAQCLESAFSKGQLGQPFELGPILAFAAFSDTLISTKPVSGVDWTKNTLARLSIVPEANAQTTGVGFRSLEVVQRLWRISRDFSYAMMTLVIVVLAFMIMFRVKISPQVAISVQSALPRIAMALILITFSYAIAGFIMDLAYVMQGIFALMFTFGADKISNLTTPQMFAQMNDAFGGVLALGLVYALIAIIPSALLSFVTLGLAAPAAVVAGLLVAVIIMIVFIYAAVRIFWLLLKSYISLLLSVIVAPYYILLGTVSPSIGFSGWLRSYIGTLAVFPVTTILILFAHTIFWSTVDIGRIGNNPGIGNNIPLLNPFQIQPVAVGATGGAPGFGTGASTFFIGLAGGLVVLLGIPKIAEGVKNSLAKPMFPYGNLLSEAIPSPIESSFKQQLGLVQKGTSKTVRGEILSWLSTHKR